MTSLQPAILRQYTHHCDVGVPPIAVVSLVHEGCRLTSEHVQGLFGEDGPAGEHG